MRGMKRDSVRCAIPSATAAVLRKRGASASFIRLKGSPHRADLSAIAVNNFTSVWKDRPNTSRYSDGTYPVLYTAHTTEVAEAERCHWISETIFKKGFRVTVRNLIMYSCKLNGECRDHTIDWKKHKELVHPDDYAHCQQIARTALGAGVKYLVVPSARKYGGVCLPVLKKSGAKVLKPLFIFDVSWDSAAMLPCIEQASSKRLVVIDRVYSML